MENIVVPTPGCWNINDIYSPNELVKEGKLVKKENGQYVAPATPSPTTPKFAPHFLLVCVFSEKCRPTWGGISRLSRKGRRECKKLRPQIGRPEVAANFLDTPSPWGYNISQQNI